MDAATDKNLRERNRALFERMLGHLGRKEFDAFEACLTGDFFQEWPYRPLPGMPESMRGAAAVRALIEKGMSDFAPYSYRIERVHELAEPEMLIAEYSSHSHFYRTGLPYSNRYISVLRFRDGKISHWREYLNPLIVKDTLGADFEKSIDERVGTGTPKDPAG